MPEQDPEDWKELEAALRRELEVQTVRTQAIEEMIASLRAQHDWDRRQEPPAAAPVPDSPAARPPVKLPTGGPDVAPIASAILASGAARRQDSPPTGPADSSATDRQREITARLDRRALRAGHARERATRGADREAGTGPLGIATAVSAVAVGAAAMFLALPHARRTAVRASPQAASPAQVARTAPATAPAAPAAVSPLPQPTYAALPAGATAGRWRVRQPDGWTPRDEPQIEISPAPPAAESHVAGAPVHPARRAARATTHDAALASTRKPAHAHPTARRPSQVLLAARPTTTTPEEDAAPMPAPVQTADVSSSDRLAASHEDGARFGTGGGGAAAAPSFHYTRPTDSDARRDAPRRQRERQRVSAPLSYGNFGDDMPGERLGRDVSGPHVADDEEQYDRSSRADRATVRICVESGQLATRWCPHTALLNVRRDRAPTRTCRLHHGP